MCCGCFDETEIEYFENEKTLKASSMVTELYGMDWGGSGNVGHIVFDDMNVSDSDIEYCLSVPFEKMDRYNSEETYNYCREVLTYFKTLTEKERYCALAHEYGCFKTNVM